MERAGAANNSLAIPAVASAAAGVLHATAAGIHAEHPDLARIFAVLALAQVGAAVFGFVRPNRIAAAALAAVNALACVGWLATRITGISWIDGLEVAEDPKLADSIAAGFAAVAVVAAVVALVKRLPAISTMVATNAAILGGVLLLPGLVAATNHDHEGHDHGDVATADGHDHTAAAGGAAASGATDAADGHTHDHGDGSDEAASTGGNGDTASGTTHDHGDGATASGSDSATGHSHG